LAKACATPALLNASACAEAAAGLKCGRTLKGCWCRHWPPEDWGTKKGWKPVKLWG